MAKHAGAPGGELTESTTIDPANCAGEASLPEAAAQSDYVDTDGLLEAAIDETDDFGDSGSRPRWRHMPPVVAAMACGVVMVVALGSLTGWLTYRGHQLHRFEQRTELYLQTGRQAATNLTTIDYTQAEADVQRVLDSATGSFYDDFFARSKPFVDVVKQAQSRSEGTVTAAGVETVSDTVAQVLVAVSVKTSTFSGGEAPVRGWRMRIAVQRVGDGAKVANVEFVP